MTNTTLSALGSRWKVSVCISFALVILLLAVFQARAQWPYPWPDSSHLPAGATQSGNVFPGGNLWGGGTLYTPANLPQRYLSWSCGDDSGLPDIHGPLDPGLATYRNNSGTISVGSDMYNLDGIHVGDTNSLPINASDSRWDWHRDYGGGCYDTDIPQSSGTVLEIGPGIMILFHISNPGNNDPNVETHAWLSFKYFGNYFYPELEDETAPQAIVAFGPGSAINGWYHDPTELATAKWGCYGFAVTFTNNSDSETFAIGNVTDSEIFVDNVQIATVTVPEPGTWGLVALGGFVLIVSRRLRCTAERT